METRAAAIAAVVEDEMRARGITQASLCDATGIAPATLNRSLRGHRALDTSELFRIADALHIKASTITRAAEARVRSAA